MKLGATHATNHDEAPAENISMKMIERTVGERERRNGILFLRSFF